MMPSFDDTIAAISTPVGVGGIGIVRLSGPQALIIAERLFQPRVRKLADNPRILCYGWVQDPDNGETVDEVLVSYMPAPNTYTCQDVVEVNAHGGPLVLRRILGLCLGCGARLAEPGEMTLRAFVNGRIDLTQAEAVRDVIMARTEASLRQAVGQLSGRLAAKVRSLRQQVVQCLAAVEAAIDFDEEDTATVDMADELAAVCQAMQGLLQTARGGIIRRQGFKVAIVGRPNVGKSSLMNALLGTERAIVTPVPGTTRDTLEEAANIGGLAVVFVDTAGLAEEPVDAVERIGMERARRALESADVVVLVLDASQPLTAADYGVAEAVACAPEALVVWNKVDLPTVPQASPLPGRRQVRVSALTGAGLPELESTLLGTVLEGEVVAGDASLTSDRHRQAVERALEAARLANEALASGTPLDMVALDLKATADALGEVTGETVHDEVLATIFSTFCVGK